MSKSLEALEELSLMINREKHINSEWNKKINDLKQTIKQDLELKDKYLNELKRWGYPETPIHISKYKALEKENQKLKKEYNLLDNTMESDDRIICELLKENEQLQNDIKLNETQIDDLTLEVANYKHALEEKNEIIMVLKEENKELLVNKNLAQAIALKYKKTIEILKDKRVNIDLLLNSSECPTYNFYAKKQDLEDLNQQEYDFLKEVLGDE